jgi:Lamin Tail Domain
VDGHEYRRVHKEMRRKRVPNIFDVDGQQVVAGTDGTSLWERRRYRACKKGAVLVEYTNGKVDSKERVATQAAGQSVDGVSTGSPVRITKIAFNPPGNDLPVTNAKLNREYVALKNVSRRPGWLTGWVLKDKIVDGHRFRFPRFRLGPGRYVRIHTGSGRNDRNDLYWNAENYIWNNSEPDRATLKAPRGVVARCRYPANASSPKRC